MADPEALPPKYLWIGAPAAAVQGRGRGDLDGSESRPRVTVSYPDGSESRPRVTVSYPDGPVSRPRITVSYPDGPE